MINILITSSGSRNKIVEYFKKELQGIGSVICCDCSPYAPSLYIADKYYIVPEIHDEHYIECILNICKKEHIQGVVSLIDPELSVLSKHQKVFSDNGIMLFVSDFDAIQTTYDKWLFYEYCLSKNIPTIPTYLSYETFLLDFNKKLICFPVFIKPRFGSCSKGIHKIDNLEDLKTEMQRNSDYIIQKFMSGQEYGIDAYVDLIDCNVISIFIKKKLLMRSGETDKAVSVKKPQLFKLIFDLLNDSGFRGPLDIDVFYENGKYYISEINPRFGGGHPLAYESGCNFFRYMINNMKRHANQDDIGNYKENVYMMKYPEVIITRNLIGFDNIQDGGEK